MTLQQQIMALVVANEHHYLWPSERAAYRAGADEIRSGAAALATPISEDTGTGKWKGCRATCEAGQQDGIGCSADSCDFEDGTRTPATPSASDTDALPQLPEPCTQVLPTGWIRYTPDQMRAYVLADRAARAGTGSVGGEGLSPLDYRAQGREEVLGVILALDAETQLDDFVSSSALGDSGDYTTDWNEDKLRELLHIGDRKHDAYDRAEAAYWEAKGHLTDAKCEMLMVEQAPFYRPLSDFLSKHKAYDLMASLKSAADNHTTKVGGAPENAVTDAARDVLAERQRQLDAEGWTPAHDDKYKKDELPRAAMCYLMNPACDAKIPHPRWPWKFSWWKPTTYRRNLVKAGALIIAEIERIDRAAMNQGDAAKKEGD